MVNVFSFGCRVIDLTYVRTYASTDCTGGVGETIKRKGGVSHACLGKSKCSSVIESLQDCESLQKDLDSLHGWSDNWHLKFNTSKCEVLTVTRKGHPFRYDEVEQQLT